MKNDKKKNKQKKKTKTKKKTRKQECLINENVVYTSLSIE